MSTKSQSPQAVGEAFSPDAYPKNKHLPRLFQPLTIRDVTFHNRIFVSPMCQYSSQDGHATDWHFVHIGGFATRGAGAICLEATAVVPKGRISPQDAGLWKDSQIAPLQKIVDFAHAYGTKIGIQLAHAGRKASTLAPWEYSGSGSVVAGVEKGGWPDDVYGPSEIAHADTYPSPKTMTEENLDEVEDGFVKAIARCKQIGFDFIELHFAHGYLMHTFLSPLSNNRGDKWGGQALDNRLRYPLRIAKKCREEWSGPLFVRISAHDWAEGPENVQSRWAQWGMEQSSHFVEALKELGIDLVDVSSGGLWEGQKITIGPGYQVPFAEELKKKYPDMLIGAVGLITDAKQAEGYLSEGKADVVFLARELIRNAHWALSAATELGVAIRPANQYARGWTRMLSSKM